MPTPITHPCFTLSSGTLHSAQPLQLRQSQTGWAVVRQRLLTLFLLCHVESDFDETCYVWCDGKGLQSYRADFEYF